MGSHQVAAQHQDLGVLRILPHHWRLWDTCGRGSKHASVRSALRTPRCQSSLTNRVVKSALASASRLSRIPSITARPRLPDCGQSPLPAFRGRCRDLALYRQVHELVPATHLVQATHLVMATQPTLFPGPDLRRGAPAENKSCSLPFVFWRNAGSERGISQQNPDSPQDCRKGPG